MPELTSVSSPRLWTGDSAGVPAPDRDQLPGPAHSAPTGLHDVITMRTPLIELPHDNESAEVLVSLATLDAGNSAATYYRVDGLLLDGVGGGMNAPHDI